MSKMDNGNISIRSLMNLMKSASEALEKDGKEDVAFYFEQIYDYVKQNPSKILEEDITRILGL